MTKITSKPRINHFKETVGITIAELKDKFLSCIITVDVGRTFYYMKNENWKIFLLVCFCFL